MSLTQLNRPSLYEAAKEVYLSTDSHWTAHLSTIGMTRIVRTKMGRIYAADHRSRFPRHKSSFNVPT